MAGGSRQLISSTEHLLMELEIANNLDDQLDETMVQEMEDTAMVSDLPAPVKSHINGNKSDGTSSVFNLAAAAG